MGATSKTDEKNDVNEIGTSNVPELDVLKSSVRNPVNNYGGTKTETPEKALNGDLVFKLTLAAKCMYFLRFGQQGVFYTYIAIFLQLAMGFSIIDCSVIFTVMMFAQTVGSNCIPVIADAYQSHTLLATLSHLAGSVITLSLFFIPQTSLIMVCIILGVGNIFIGGCMPLSDAAVFQICKQHGANFGLQRLWGCLGWGLFAAICSCICFGTFRQMWYVYAALTPFTVIAICVLLTMVHAPVPPSVETKPAAPSARPSQSSDGQSAMANFWTFVLHPVVALFLTSVFFMGALFGSSSVLYMSIWAIEDLHASVYVLGVAALVMNIFEIPMFFIAGDFGKRFGVHGALYLSSCAYGFWLLAYGYLVHNGWWIVALQPLHALAFALQIGSLGTFTTKIANAIEFPSASAQGFKQGALNLGRAVGFIVAGVLYQVYSAEFMFRVMGYSSILMFLCVGAVQAAARMTGNGDLLYL